VEIAAFLTIWAMFSCYLLFHVMELPVLLPRTAMTLLVAELLALGIWSYGSEDCLRRPCGAAAETARDAAAFDVPLLAGLFVLVTAIGGLRAARKQAAASSRVPVGHRARRLR
jgi:hypothetical protein